MTLAEFYAARLAEDEAAARRDMDSTLPMRYVDADADSTPLIEAFGADRVLREVEAKRAILGRHKPINYHGIIVCQWDTCSEGAQPWPCPDSLALAAAWSGHPDYDLAWRPE